jgi:hypothetical protein
MAALGRRSKATHQLPEQDDGLIQRTEPRLDRAIASGQSDGAGPLPQLELL